MNAHGQSYDRIYRRAAYCVGIGLWVMSVALFLHPTTPQDFLALAFSTPLETINATDGNCAAAAFWSGIMFVFAGLIGFIWHMHHRYLDYHPT